MSNGTSLAHGVFQTAHRWLLPIGLAIIFFVYWPGLHGGFFFDDHPNILQVEGIRLANLSPDAIYLALKSGTTGVLGRPISQLSFAINYYFSGYAPFAFKITNLLIHCLNTILIYLLAAAILTAKNLPIRPRNTALIAGVIAFTWAIHPIQLTSVLYVVQRMTSLSAMFLLLAILFHVRARQINELQKRALFLLIVAWTVFWPLSVLSKESGILFPVFITAYELIIRRKINNGLDNFGRIFLVLAIVAIATFPFIFLLPVVRSHLGGYEYRPFTLIQRLLTEARVIWEYLGLISIPQLENFALFHDDITISTGLTKPWTTLPAIFGLGGLVWFAYWSRSRAPLVAFGISWFLIGHILESTFLPLEIAHEHRNYLAFFGILLLPIDTLTYLTEKKGAIRTLVIALCIAIIGYFGLLTALRANMYGDEGLRTQIETSYHPESARSNFEAGRFLSRLFDEDPSNQIAYTLARKNYDLATALDPAFKMGLLGLIHLECARANSANRKDVDELVQRLEKTIFSPGDATLMFSLQSMSVAGKLCLPRSDMDALFSAALVNPRVSSHVQMLLHSWHADYLWLRERDLESARSALWRALKIAPLNPSNRLKMAQLLYISGKHDEALELLLKLHVNTLQPDEQKTLSELFSALGSNRQGNQ